MKNLASYNLHKIAFCCIFFILCFKTNAQTTFSWNGTYSGSGQNRTYTATTVGGITMTATINNSENVWQNSSPRFIASGSSVVSGCSGISADNQGLLLSTDWTNNTTKTITVTITFSHTVGAVRFKLYDINDDGYGSWRDKVTISAVNGTGSSVNIYNEGTACVSTGGSVSGNGTSMLTYDSGKSSACTCYGNNSVRIGSDASGCYQVKSITIQYKSGVSPSSYNNPSQYIIISDLIAYCAPLPIELFSFTGFSDNRTNVLTWETASEKNNDYFELERSVDGEVWETVAKVDGAGTTTDVHTYSYLDTDFEYVMNYYRLKQVDYDGTEKESGIIVIDNSVRNKELVKVLNSLGQEVSDSEKGLKFFIYNDGTVVKQMD